ncbi:MAG: dynamin family protein [Planctomycetota bacterium]|jgi:hypothetical protein|nr:dynamin family protein [Planctomycetota bacterium]
MVNQDVVETILEQRRAHIVPVAANQRMELLPEPALRTPPMVLLLGNHSSGKSSLINHLLDQDVQRTGVAPTDDGFTVLLHGERPRAIDGEALTSNPELPFTELKQFGPGLVQHVEGRVLAADLLQHVRLIDSPGMIDASGSDAERPYDFAQVVRWFAQQSDLILLFFDPEKPGTTGETLSVLNESLTGIDHKLRIVMNKMDLFDGIRDFARTYGALCWNLSRSLNTKDMPHIYTTVIPEMVREDCKLPLDGFAAALLELEAYIGDLPGRRVDSVLSRVLDEGHLLLLRSTVTEALRRKVTSARINTIVACALSAGVAAGIGWMLGREAWQHALIPGVLALVALGLLWWLPGVVGRWREQRGFAELDTLFNHAFRDLLAGRERADDLQHDWARARAGLLRMLKNVGLKGLKRTSRGQRKRLAACIGETLPAYRSA